jgi:hypothetical protein
MKKMLRVTLYSAFEPSDGLPELSGQTLRVTPAMEAGIADHVWSIEEIVGLLG